jgi:hypothetical protein
MFPAPRMILVLRLLRYFMQPPPDPPLFVIDALSWRCAERERFDNRPTFGSV